jgi:hypothetical protein
MVPCAQPASLRIPATERIVPEAPIARSQLGVFHTLTADLAVAEELLGEADAAHVHAVYGHGIERVAYDELGASTADVHHQSSGRRARDAVRHAQVNQTSLFTTWNDVDAVAERLAELPQYLTRVAGLTERVRPDGPHLPGAKIAEPLAEQGEALDRAFLRLFVERAVFLKARRQAHWLPP